MARLPDVWLRRVLVVVALGLPIAVLAALREIPGIDPMFRSPSFHLMVVSAIAACALVVAIVAAGAAGRSRRGGPVLLALGTVVVGLLMLAHGFTTPGVFGGPAGGAYGGRVIEAAPNQWVGRFPVLAITGFAVCLLLAAANESSPVTRLAGRRPWLVLGIPTAALGAFVAVVVPDPTRLAGDHHIWGEHALDNAVLGLATAALLVASHLQWKRWVLGREPFQLALVFSAWLSIAALLALHYGSMWRMSWWNYHAFLLAGFSAAVFAVVSGALRGRRPREAVSTLFADDPYTHIRQGYPDALRALVAAVEAKDAYTHGHSARVAEIATKLGSRLGLPPSELRSLAQGAYLHDIGKIGVPDAVLNKEGRLDPEEREWIEQHPRVGWEIASPAESLRPALDVILQHHERWDGAGYPQGLIGTGISRAARICAVADVWDALTTDRAYRPAWPEDRALDHVVAGRGTHFDPDVVDALVVLLRERAVVASGAPGDVAVAVAAVADCT